MQDPTCIIHFPCDDAPPFETRVALVHQIAVTAGAMAADAVVDVLDRADMATEMLHAADLFIGTLARNIDPDVRPSRMVALLDIQAAFLAGFAGRVQQVMMHAGIGVARH